MLTLDRIKHGKVGGPVMVEVTRGNVASLFVFLATFLPGMACDVTVDELCVLVLKGRC